MTEMQRDGGSSPELPRQQGPRAEIPLTLAVRNLVEEVSLMVSASLPVLRSLRIAESIESNQQLKAVLGAICTDVEGGSSVSEAMLKHPGVFSSSLCSMIRAGEIGGVFDIALQRAVELADWEVKIKNSRTPDYTTQEMRLWANHLGYLIHMGVPILEAVKESKAGLSAESQAGIDAIHEAIREGDSFANGMRAHRKEHGVFDEVLIQFVDVGEETGDLDKILMRFGQRTETLTN